MIGAVCSGFHRAVDVPAATRRITQYQRPTAGSERSRRDLRKPHQPRCQRSRAMSPRGWLRHQVHVTASFAGTQRNGRDALTPGARRRSAAAVVRQLACDLGRRRGIAGLLWQAAQRRCNASTHPRVGQDRRPADTTARLPTPVACCAAAVGASQAQAALCRSRDLRLALSAVPFGA